MAEAHNHATLFLDELAQVDPKDAAETAYLLGNGQGKARMSRSLGVRRRLEWTILYVSAGELSLSEHAATAGKKTKGGAEVRLLNIDSDAGQGLGLFEELHGIESPDAFSRHLKDSARRVYGAPFRTFLQQLTRNRDDVTKTVRAARDVFLARFVPDRATGEAQRAAGRFALIGAAGELATQWGLTGWREGEAIGAAERCFKEWLIGRGTCGSADAENAIRQMRAFLEMGGASRFQTLNSTFTEAERIINRAGFKRVSNTGETEYIILPEVFKTEVCKGYSPAVVLRELDKRGFLVREHPNMTIKPRLPELGSVRVYCIRAAILDG